MTLTAFDTHGKPFVRALLQDQPSGETLVAAQQLLEAGDASFSVFDVAHELGIRVSLAAVHAATTPPKRTPAPPRKSRNTR